MNTNCGMIWNINASLFQSEQRVRELCHLVATLRRQLVAEQKAYRNLNQLVRTFTTELENYANSLSNAETTPDANGTQ